jgi:hypothetical protein
VTNMKNPAVNEAVENNESLRMIINESVAYHTLERNVINNVTHTEVLDDRDFKIHALNMSIALANRQSYDPEISTVIGNARRILDFLTES